MNFVSLLTRPTITLRLKEANKDRSLFDRNLEIETLGWGLLSIKISKGGLHQLLFRAGANALRKRTTLKLQPETKVTVWLISLIGIKRVETILPASPFSVKLGCQPSLGRLKTLPSSRFHQASIMSYPGVQAIRPIRYHGNTITILPLKRWREFPNKINLQSSSSLYRPDGMGQILLDTNYKERLSLNTKLYQISMRKS